MSDSSSSSSTALVPVSSDAAGATDAGLSYLSYNTLRKFLDDCLDSKVGPSLALERISSGNIAELERLARYSIECEERLQTGCMMVQALTLVRYWMLLSTQSTIASAANERAAIEWLCQWYSKQSDAIDHPNKRSRSSGPLSRMIQWRASFAVKLYRVVDSEHFAQLLYATTTVRISTLRVLQMRFWEEDNLPLFTSILQFVSKHSISKQLIEGAILGWTRADSVHLSASSLLEEFAARIKNHVTAEATQKCLREAENVMAASEFKAIQQLQYVYAVAQTQQSAIPTPATVVVSSSPHHALFPSPTPTTASEATTMQMAPDFPPPVIATPSLPPSPQPPPSPPRTRRSTVADAPLLVTMDVDEVCESSAPPPIPIIRRAREKRKASTPQHRQSPKRRRGRVEVEESTEDEPSDPESEVMEPEPEPEPEPVSKGRQPPPPPKRSARGDRSPYKPNDAAAVVTSAEIPRATLPSSSDRAPMQAIRPIAFARPMGEALPFEPIVAAHLKEYGIAVVQPSFREHTECLHALNYDLLQHSNFRYAYRMTLSCFNDGSSHTVDEPSPPSLPDGVYPSSVSAEEVFAFLEAEWAHMLDPSRSHASMPKPPAAAIDCVYLKDLSIEHELRGAKSAAKSFFPKWDMRLALQDEEGRQDELAAAAASLCAVQATTRSTVSEAKQLEGDVAPRSEPYPALYLDAYADHPASLLRLASVRCDGVHNAYAYLKFGFQFFNLHIEQCLLPFVHHQLSGESTWTLIPHSERHKLRGVVQRMAHVRRNRNCNDADDDNDGDVSQQATTVAPVFLYSKSLLPPPSLLREYDIQFHQVRLSAGQVLVAHGGFAHYGFSTSPGETHALACNIMSEDWLVSGGPEFMVQFFEWVLDLSSLSPKAVARELAKCGLEEHHLANALNTCPPAFSCALMNAIRSDLLLYEHNEEPYPKIKYSLRLDQVRKALATLETALDLLHQPDVRAFLKRVYVAEHSDLCKCKSSAAASHAPSLPPETLKRLYASMEREHALVVGSGDETSISQMGRTRQATAAEMGDSTTHCEVDSEEEEMPISLAFGSATHAPMARLLEFLCSKEVTPPSLRLSRRSRFLDIGSGIGQVVLHAQLRYALASAIGIEYVPNRYAAGEKTLKALKDASRVDVATLSGGTSPYDFASLRPALDDRLERVQFVHGRIERHLELLADATHVFMFDAAFNAYTRGTLLPCLCTGPPRIVITCLAPDRMHRAWPVAADQSEKPSAAEISRLYRKLGQFTLTMAGSNSTREAYVYATAGSHH